MTDETRILVFGADLVVEICVRMPASCWAKRCYFDYVMAVLHLVAFQSILDDVALIPSVETQLTPSEMAAWLERLSF